MSIRFKLQTSGFMEDIRGFYGCDTDYICWLLRVSYDEAEGLLFERGYAYRWHGNHIKLGELDAETVFYSRCLRGTLSSPLFSNG